jgi:hypothetical protein
MTPRKASPHGPRLCEVPSLCADLLQRSTPARVARLPASPYIALLLGVACCVPHETYARVSFPRSYTRKD